MLQPFVLGYDAARGDQLPAKRGARFSTNARTPSLKSSLA
jgi:hypothetical protein